jgi:hypothetical protein
MRKIWWLQSMFNSCLLLGADAAIAGFFFRSCETIFERQQMKVRIFF